MGFYNLYKRKYHFSVNFFSIFLLITFLPDFIGISEPLIKYSFWFLKAVFASWIILKYRRKIFNLSLLEKLFLFVAIVYFINIFIDVFWQTYPFGIGDPIDLVGFFLSILIAFSFRYDDAFGSKTSYFFFLITLSIGLLMAYFLAQESPAPLIGRFRANSIVNSINYGQMGCALSLIALYGFSNLSFKFSKILYPLLFLLGMVSIIKAGSRSPVVILIVVSSIFFLANSGFIKGLLVLGVALIAIYFSLSLIIELSDALDSGIVKRLTSAIETGETSGRDAIYTNAINQFKGSPIFGSFYLIANGIGKGGYPHNFVLEAFMTTGIIGGIPFLLMIIFALVRSFLVIRRKHPSGWIMLLFLQMLVYGFFSSSLYSSQDFWALCFFILSMEPSVFKKFRKVSNPISLVRQ